MSNIKWGPLIFITDGKRPSWLDDSEKLPYLCEGKPTAILWQANDPSKRWDTIAAICVRADHPHYHPASKPAPAVDWTKPIEAVHEDGRVAAVDRRDTTKRTDVTWWAFFGGKSYIVDLNGFIQGSDWRIRNVAEPIDMAKWMEETFDRVSRDHWHGLDTPTPTNLAERMEALVRRLATELVGPTIAIAEAKAIVAEMTPPVDPDKVEAHKLYKEALTGTDGCPTWEDALLRAIKRGRELERGQ